jgi:hypothetical protein
MSFCVRKFGSGLKLRDELPKLRSSTAIVLDSTTLLIFDEEYV